MHLETTRKSTEQNLSRQITKYQGFFDHAH